MFVKSRRFKTEIIVLHMESIYKYTGAYLKKSINYQITIYNLFEIYLEFCKILCYRNKSFNELKIFVDVEICCLVICCQRKKERIFPYVGHNILFSGFFYYLGFVKELAHNCLKITRILKIQNFVNQLFMWIMIPQQTGQKQNNADKSYSNV